QRPFPAARPAGHDGGRHTSRIAARRAGRSPAPARPRSRRPCPDPACLPDPTRPGGRVGPAPQAAAPTVSCERSYTAHLYVQQARLAAVDIGTNSMRLVIAEVQPDGSYRVLDQDREMTRLGRGLYASGRIGDGPMEQSLQTLGRMKAIAEGFGVSELRAIATSAVR